MKKFIMLVAVCVAMFSHVVAQVAVNADGSLPASTAMLDVSSTTKGMLIPRMSTVQRTAIASPAAGLLVYDTGTKSFWYYDNAIWNQIANGGVPASSYIKDADGNTKVETEKNPNENLIRFTINNNERMRLENKWLHATFPLYSLSIGDSAGALNSTGYDNTFIGYQAGRYNTSGDYNTFIGKSAGTANSTGGYNTFTGRAAGFENTTGWYNSFYGMKSGSNNKNGSYNSFFGHYSGVSNDSGYKNTFIGSQAGYNNESGYNNSFQGRSSGYSNISGSDNCFYGVGSGYSNTIGNRNIAIGSLALYSNASNSDLIAIGDSAMFNNVNGGPLYGYGNNNIGIGTSVLLTNQYGAGNTAIGYHALRSQLPSESYRTAIGFKVGTGYADGETFSSKSGCTMIGSMLEANGVNTILIGYNIRPEFHIEPDNNYMGKTNHSIIIGENIRTQAPDGHEIILGSDVQTSLRCPAAVKTTTGGYELFISSSGYFGYHPAPSTENSTIENMGSIEWLYQLRPVNYILNSDDNQTKQFGLVAEEVVQVAPEFVVLNKDNQPESVSYSSLVAPLLKAVQELKTRTDAQAESLDDLKKQNGLLQKRIEQLEQK